MNAESTEPEPTKFNPIPVLGFGIAAIAALMILFGGGSGSMKSLKGEALPAISSNTNATWLNSDKLTWDALKGKVVWVEFSFIH